MFCVEIIDYTKEGYPMEEEIKKTPLELAANEIRRCYLHPLTKEESLQTSFHTESTRYRSDGPFQRDYARIMYSSSFRRLQGKMQLLGIKNDQFFRNRLTHSLEVSQIAKSIAYTIGYDSSETFVVEAGALAHDIGNPPFGHAGEQFLNSNFANIGGFEGNAQTLRILTNLEKKQAAFRGLNLTYRTLLSVVKYFNKFDKQLNEKGVKQKFIYDSDYEFLSMFVQEKNIILRTLDVQIVDIADEIAYAAHDLEDGLRIKAFNIDEILQEYQCKYGDTPDFKILEQYVNKAKDKAGYHNNKTASTEFSKLFRQELSSSLINLFLSDIDLCDTDRKNEMLKYHNKELNFMKHGGLVHGLKGIVFKCINNNDEVYAYEQKGRKVIDFLCELYRENHMYLPPEYRAEELINQYADLEKTNKCELQERMICDYIAGMMDSFALSTYEKFNGRLK